ncbi:asparagine synthase-related protein [Nonomuraea sp. NPDC050790]|uniref:asparagine synthase-related protein n=1 Tax=Nonomuraea sp. NPDC050790 TaxID=3364371 RepID=UPI0037AA1589
MENPTPTRSTTGDPPGFAVTVDPAPPGEFRLYGRWPADQVLTVEHGETRLVALGHRLPQADAATADLADAVRAGDFDRLGRWPGSGLVVVLSPAAVLVYPDLAGQFGVHFASRAGRTVIAQHARVVARMAGLAPDPLSAAVAIACADVLPLAAGRSPFAGARSVEGGQVLEVTGRGTRVRVHHPRAVFPGAGLADSADLLRRALVSAVDARCGDPARRVTADFSGGLDSTSIAALAARRGAAPVEAVVYHHASAPADDLAHAVRAARATRGIVLRRVVGDQHTLPYQGLHRLEPAEEPVTGLLAVRRAALRLDWAAARGSGAHLTGEGGDALLWSGPAYLADLLAPGSLARLWRDGHALARMRGLSPALLVTRAARLAGTPARRALGRLAADLRRPPSRDATAYDALTWWSPPGEVLGWLSRESREGLAESAGDPATAGRAAALGPPSAHATHLALREAAAAQRFLRELGARRGLAVHAPLLDNDVVESCVRLRAAERADTRTYKPLLVRSVAGLVPRQVVERAGKGDYLAEEYQGARRAGSRLHALMGSSLLADLGVIRPEAVRLSLTKLTSGVPVPLGPLNRLLALELWLRALDSQEGRG